MINRDNYQQLNVYLRYLAEVMQLNPQSVGRYRAYLRHLLLWADARPFCAVADLRPTLPAHVTSVAPRGEESALAPATVKKILHTSQRFFRWAKLTYSEEFAALPEAWVATLRPPRLAQPLSEHQFVTLEEALVLARLPVDPTDLSLRRDQAAAALLYLSGMRVGALGSLPLAAVDIAQGTIKQWPSLGVHTKNSKTATTYLLPIPELLAVAEAWDSFVRSQLPETAMWYTTIAHNWGMDGVALSPERAGAARNVLIGKRLRVLYAEAELPFKSAHKFRHGHAVWALQHAATMADYKAVSQNLMHGDVRITDSIYAPLLGSEVQHRIANLTGGTAMPVNPNPEPGNALASFSKAELAALLQQAIAQLKD